MEFTVELGILKKELVPIADAYVRNDKPYSNFGNEGELIVGTNEVGTQFRSFINFDLMQFYTGYPFELIAAFLELYCHDFYVNLEELPTGFPEGVINYLMTLSSPWTESEVTWNNQPTLDRTLWAFVSSYVGNIRLDVTDQIMNVFKGAELFFGYGLLGYPDLHQYARFYSREGDFPPKLLVYYRSYEPLETRLRISPSSSCVLDKKEVKISYRLEYKSRYYGDWCIVVPKDNVEIRFYASFDGGRSWEDIGHKTHSYKQPVIGEFSWTPNRTGFALIKASFAGNVGNLTCGGAEDGVYLNATTSEIKGTIWVCVLSNKVEVEVRS